MKPIRAAQTWISAALAGLVVTALIAKVAHALWPELRAASAAAFAAPGVALAVVLLLVTRKKLVARAKGAVKEGLRGR